MTPTITIGLTEEGYELLASSYSVTNPAGERLFRAPPYPAIRFQHDDRQEAERDRDILQRYLDAPSKGRKQKRGAEEAEETIVAALEITDAVWM